MTFLVPRKNCLPTCPALALCLSHSNAAHLEVGLPIPVPRVYPLQYRIILATFGASLGSFDSVFSHLHTQLHLVPHHGLRGLVNSILRTPEALPFCKPHSALNTDSPHPCHQLVAHASQPRMGRVPWECSVALHLPLPLQPVIPRVHTVQDSP